LIGQLLFQAVVALDAASSSDVGRYVLDAITPFRWQRWPIRTLFKMDFVGNLGVLDVPVILTNFLHKARPFVAVVVLDVRPQCHPSTLPFSVRLLDYSKAAKLALRLFRPVVETVDALTWIIIVMRTSV
jgi:hypothetical protein